jgi:cobalt-zinc-cadmium efflux system membrane fusion protein
MVKNGLIYFIAFCCLAAMLGAGLYFFDLYSLDFLKNSDGQEVAKQEETDHSIEDNKEEEPHSDSILKLTTEQVKKMGIEIQQANPIQLTMTRTSIGKIGLHPDHFAHVLPQVSGVIKEAKKNMGDFVKAGEVVAVLESQEMAEGKANYLQAISKQNLAYSLLEQERGLYEKGISSEKEYLSTRWNYEESAIQAQLALQKLYTLGLEEGDLNDLFNQNLPHLRLYEVKAPIDGIILSRHLTKGEFVDQTKIIYEIADLSRVWIELGIHPQDLSKVKEGQMVQLLLVPENFQALAKIIYLSPVIQEDHILVKAIAELENPRREWSPGRIVHVTLPIEKVSVQLAVCQEAMQEIEEKNCVFVLNPEGFEKREVEIGRTDSQYVEVLSGLQPGDLYVARQAFLLKAEIGKNSLEDDD